MVNVGRPNTLNDTAKYRVMDRHRSIHRLACAGAELSGPSSILFLTQGFVNFSNHCKDLVSLIVEQGTAVALTESALRKRKSLGLSSPEYDIDDIRILAEVTGL